MFINVFLFVPAILIRERFDGAVMAMLIGILIGTVFLFLFITALNKLPQISILDMLEEVPKAFRFSLLFLLIVMWYSAGAITLLSFNDVITQFVNPTMPGKLMIIIFILFLSLTLTSLNSSKILYTIELVLVLNLPLFLIIIYQAYTNDYLSIHSILEIGSHLFERPSWSTIAASSYIFSGYINMIIFNKVFDSKINVKLLILITFIGIANVITSFFIPIGLWGADGVGDLAFPWVSTADTLSIEYGPVERVITIFILFYVSIALISVLIHWHVTLEMIKSMAGTEKLGGKIQSIITWIILICFGIIVLLLEHYVTDKDVLNLGELWLKLRLPCEAFLVVFIVFWVRWKTR